MGLDGLQTYVESKLGHCIEKNVDLKTIKNENIVEGQASKKIPQIFVVHAESCRKYVYPMSTDWVCGGQWNEMLSNLEKFVRSFRQSNIELVVFFDGSVSPSRKHEWKRCHSNQRETMKQLMSKVVSNRATPSRSLAVTPACFNTALRLALKSCNVIVCSSLGEVHHDITHYYRSQKCSGIIAQNSYYLLQRVSNCFSPEHLKLTRYHAKSSSINFEKVMEELGLSIDSLPVFAALIGSMMLPDGYLATFHWTFLGPDHPLRKVELKGKISYESQLPPNDMVIKGVADLLKDKDVSDIDALAKEVFKDSGYDLNEATNKLKESIEYFRSSIQSTSQTPDEDPQGTMNRDGFPIHNFGSTVKQTKAKTTKTIEDSYQKRWQQFQKVQLSTKPTVQASQESQANDGEDAKDASATENGSEEADQKKDESTSEKPEEEKKKVEEVPDEKPAINGVEEDNSQKIEENGAQATNEEPYRDPYEDIKPILTTIPEEVVSIARRRHQGGEMCQEIIQILTKGEILIDTAIDEEHATMRPPIPLLYRPIRQLIYGILYDQKIHEEQTKDSLYSEDMTTTLRHVKEYCVYKSNRLDNPDLVEPVSMPWDIPAVKNLWLGRQAEDNTTRMKAFLHCLRSDTQNMSNLAMVPQRLLLLCCVLRYLIQQEGGKSILSRHDIDAFLAQALSPHLTTEANSMNLANLKLNQIDVRAMQLASIFMSGVEAAILANDACGSPVPWEFCCPWLFFDGKLFHSKWLQSSMNVATLELCDGKPQLAEKLERLRWCITEGLGEQFKITGLKPVALTSGSPFGTPPASLLPAPAYGTNDYRPAGSNTQLYANKGSKGRGASSKRPVLASGGTLEVAGVPVAHWSGNKSGMGYNRDNPDVIVGGRNSVDLPSDSRARRGLGRTRVPNKGRGLLPTPLFSPWPVDYDGMRGVQQSYSRGGPANHMPMMPRSGGRPQGRSLYRPTPSASNRRNDYPNNQPPRNRDRSQGQPPFMQKSPHEMWVGKGRGQGLSVDDGLMGVPNEEKFAHGGRGWSRS